MADYKPTTSRTDTLENWRQHTNRISDNVGHPQLFYTTDAPNNTGAVYTNTSDSYTHPVEEADAIESALNDLNSRKVKRTGDTITGHLNILQNFGANGNVTLGTNGSNTVTINSTPVSIPNGLNFDSNTLVINSSNNRVGVNVAAPTVALDVLGNTLLTGTLEVTQNAQFDADIEVRGGDITTNQTSFNLLNATATSINLGGAATTITLGYNDSTSYVSIRGTKVSTTSSNGALVVSGGLGVGESVNIATSVTVPVVYSQSATGGYLVVRANRTDLTTGYVAFNDTTDATTSTTGAARFAGGVGIAKKLYVGTDAAVTGGTTLSGALTQNGTGNLSVTTTGTATISPTGATTLGTAGQTTTLSGNVSAITSNQTITLSPTGASGTVTIAPTLLGTINNMSIGATTRSTGAFTTLTANDAVTFTKNTENTLGTIASGAVQISGGVGIALNTTIGGDLQVKGGDILIEGTPNVQAITAANAVGLFNTTTGTVTLGAATSTLTAQSQIINMATAGSSKYVSILADDAAAGTTGSGALRVAGGVGIAKTLYVGGSVSFTGTSSTTINQTGNTTISSTGNVSLTNTGNITISPTTSGQVVMASITTGTINNMSIGATTRSTGAFTTLTANDTVTMTKDAAASSTTTGTLQVTGGVGATGAVYCVGLYSDNISSIGSGGNGNLTLTGIGTGKVIVNDDLTVNLDVTVTGGDIVLGDATLNTISASTVGSTIGLFTTSTGTINLATGGTTLNVNKTGSTTTFNGTSSFAGNISQTSTNTFSTGTGNISLNGNIITSVKFSSDATNTDADFVTFKTTSSSVSPVYVNVATAATYSAAEVLVQCYDGTNRQLSKILLAYNGTDTSTTEYGTTIAGSAQVATFTSDINTGNIRLIITPKAATATTYKIVVSRITV